MTDYIGTNDTPPGHLQAKQYQMVHGRHGHGAIEVQG